MRCGSPGQRPELPLCGWSAQRATSSPWPSSLAILRGCRFERVGLSGAWFGGLDLSGAVMRGAELSGAGIHGEIAGLAINGGGIGPRRCSMTSWLPAAPTGEAFGPAVMRCELAGRRIGSGARTGAGQCRAGRRWGRCGAAQACAGPGDCGCRGGPPGSAGHQPAASCCRRRGMAGQEHHCASEGDGPGRYQCRVLPVPRQRADPPRAGGGPVTRHRTGMWAPCPHAPPCAIKPGGVTVATRRGGKRRTRTSRPAPARATQPAPGSC
jgi:hypothetical protein